MLVPASWFTSQDAEIEFEIREGQTLSDIANILSGADLILNRRLFVAYALFIGSEKDIKAGNYRIGPAMSTHELVRLFTSGDSKSNDVEIVIPEGTNVADIGLILEKAGYVEKEYFLKHEILLFEGNLFPDTYRIDRDIKTSRETFVINFLLKLNKNYYEKTEPILKNLGQDERLKTIIIASMLEKEVRTEEDMMVVAGIIEKRLELGMPLELDASVAYGVCYRQFIVGKYCDVSRANIVDNIAVDSEYNTYKRKGLPIGPISNPGLKAVRAALSPQPSDYLFYLSARDGTTIFSKTAVEHERARQKYLK